MGKTSIKMYYDVVSPYAYMGVEVLRRYRDYWGNRIDVEFIPFFLGGIMAGTGNRPPASLPAKAVYMPKDISRSSKLKGMPAFRLPTVFPIQSYKQMRIICALKDAEDRGEASKDTSLKAAKQLWIALWTEDKNTSDEAVMQKELDPILPGGWEKWKYAMSDPQVKKRLTDLTSEALNEGAFGAPWWIITNSKGETDVFFGSDRWEHVFDFIGEEFLGYFPGEQAKSKL